MEVRVNLLSKGITALMKVTYDRCHHCVGRPDTATKQSRNIDSGCYSSLGFNSLLLFSFVLLYSVRRFKSVFSTRSATLNL
jgi:hypothetical protein